MLNLFPPPLSSIQSYEAQKLSQLADKWSRIDEASQKRSEFNNNFIAQTKEQLEKKMEVITENRESHINTLRAKLKDHVSLEPSIYSS